MAKNNMKINMNNGNAIRIPVQQISHIMVNNVIIPVSCANDIKRGMKGVKISP